jgi:hypothetical protein
MPGKRGSRARRWQRLDPSARLRDRQNALRIAREVAAELVGRGAVAVVLGGSWARGDARRASDLDLWAFGLGRGNEILWRPPLMVTVDRTSVAEQRRRLCTPPFIGGSVPGWRSVRILHDPTGVADRLRREAQGFRWTRVSGACDRWVAGQVVAWAEEAVKLVRALATGNRATAAVQRNLLADHLGFVLAIHRRIFWDSENELWERIGREVGGEWAGAQRQALGVAPGGFEASCRGALSLYRATAAAVWPTLAAEQRSIVGRTLDVIGEPPIA